MSDDFTDEDFADEYVGSGGSIDYAGMARALSYAWVSTIVVGILDYWYSVGELVSSGLDSFMDRYVGTISDAFGVPSAVFYEAAEETSSFLDLLGVAAFPVALVIGILVLVVMNEVYSSVLG